MAVSAPHGRDRAIQLVQQGLLPISLGEPPIAMVLHQDGKYRIREVVPDKNAALAAAAAAGRPRSASWMPQHYYSLGQPTGEVFAEAESLEDLLAVIRTMDWPAQW
jgi:hypothetical protein